jgi:large subunit ribosomal protein L11
MPGKIEVPVLVEGGKASGGPPLAPAIGPLGIPIKAVVDAINAKTAGFKGLKVPVVVIADPVTKEFEIRIKTPMASALLLKEAEVEKGSGKPNETFVADLTFEQVLNVTKMKRDSLNALDLRGAVKTVLGTAVSAGIKCDGKTAKEVLKAVDDGVYNDQLKE